jgi:hypothetical protein
MVKSNDTVKMARPGEPEAVRTTIVGGQPPGSGRPVGAVPRGVEVLVKKAAVDPAFKKLLLEKRARAADDIALQLSPAEAAMLEAVPAEQLRAIIGNTKVSPRLRPAFLGYAASVMLAALGAATAACDSPTAPPATLGSQPDPPPKYWPAETSPEKGSAPQNVKRGAAEKPLTDKAPLEPATEENR